MGNFKQAAKLIAFVATILFLTGALARSEKNLAAEIKVDAGRELHEINPLVYGHFIEHLGMCIKDGLWTPKHQKHNLVLGGVREDLFNAIGDLNMPMLRWPGGCFSDGYHWKDGIGPVEERPIRKNLAWARGDAEETPQGPLEDNAFGADEFLRLCETLGTEPLINVNLGSGTAEEARQWVEYANGGADTEYGSLRARNGHPEPYGVKYWGIGNESWGQHEIGYFKTGREYAEKYLEFARAMKSVDQDIELLAVGAVPALSAWNKEVLEFAGNEIDFLSLHVYFPGLVIVPTWKGNPKREYYGIMAAGRELDTFLDAFDAQIKKYSPPGADVRMALDEWNLWWNGQQIVRAEDYEFSSSLFTADILIRLLKRGDRAAFANFAQLVNVLGLVITDPGGGMYFTGGYYAFKLFANLSGDRMIQINVDSPTFKNNEYGIVTPKNDNPLLEAVAITDDKRSSVEIVVLNKHYDREIKAKIELEGFSAPGSCEATEITAPSPHSKNTFEEPGIVQEKRDIKCSFSDGTALEYSFPPHSITLITLIRSDSRISKVDEKISGVEETSKTASSNESHPTDDTPEYLKGELKEVIIGTEMPNNIYSIYKLDVFSYYNLQYEYDTELKKKVFTKTAEYQSKLNELKQIKQELLSAQLYTTLPLHIDYFSYFSPQIPDYDLNKKGFNIYIGSNQGRGTLMARAPKSINNIYFPSLPTRNSPYPEMGAGVFEEFLFLHISEENGLAVENNRTNVRIFFVFRIDSAETVKFKYLCETYGWYDMELKLLTAKSVRVIAANTQNGDVYYNKSY